MPFEASASEDVRLTAINSHSWTDSRLTKAEASCHEFGVERLSKRTDALSEIAFESPDWWETAIDEVDSFLFPKISVHTKEGEVRGIMLCSFERGTSRAFEVSYSFHGDGLPWASDDKLAKLLAKNSIKTARKGQTFLTFARTR